MRLAELLHWQRFQARKVEEMGRKMLVVAASMAMLVTAVAAEAHKGRTDKSGCHKQRSTGTYHCHKKKR